MWALACTRPGAEQKAFDNIKNQGFELYRPQYLSRRVTRARMVEQTKSLFPNYIFVRVENQWRVLLSTLGVRRLLLRRIGDAFEPQPVPEWIIADLRAQERDGLYQFPAEPGLFSPRQTLRAIGGLLKGKFCICEEMTDVDRVRVLFRGLHFEFRTEMPADQLEAV